jgi:hypothetical protein
MPGFTCMLGYLTWSNELDHVIIVAAYYIEHVQVVGKIVPCGTPSNLQRARRL